MPRKQDETPRQKCTNQDIIVKPRYSEDKILNHDIQGKTNGRQIAKTIAPKLKRPSEESPSIGEAKTEEKKCESLIVTDHEYWREQKS